MEFVHKQAFPSDSDPVAAQDEAVDGAREACRLAGTVLTSVLSTDVVGGDESRDEHLTHLGDTHQEAGEYVVRVRGERRDMTVEERAADPDVSAQDEADAEIRRTGLVGPS